MLDGSQKCSGVGSRDAEVTSVAQGKNSKCKFKGKGLSLGWKKQNCFEVCLETFLARQGCHGACCLLDDGLVGIDLLLPLGWVNAQLHGHAFPKQLPFHSWPTCPAMKSFAWLYCGDGTELGMVSHQVGNEQAHIFGGQPPTGPQSGSLASGIPARHWFQQHKLGQPPWQLQPWFLFENPEVYMAAVWNLWQSALLKRNKITWMALVKDSLALQKLLPGPRQVKWFTMIVCKAAMPMWLYVKHLHLAIMPHLATELSNYVAWNSRLLFSKATCDVVQALGSPLSPGTAWALDLL